jgi:hypothetical protein
MSQPMQDPESGNVDAEAVVHFLGRQVGGLSVQLAMREVRAEEQERRIAELEQEVHRLTGVIADVPSSVLADEDRLKPPTPPASGPGPKFDGPPPAADDAPTTIVPAPPAKAGR